MAGTRKARVLMTNQIRHLVLKNFNLSKIASEL